MQWYWDAKALTTIVLGPYEHTELLLIKLACRLDDEEIYDVAQTLRPGLRALLYFECAHSSKTSEVYDHFMRLALQALGFRVIYNV